MSVVAKFKCVSVIPEGESRTVSLQAVYSSDPSSENYTWSQYTPSGSLQMHITNPKAFDQFQVGQEYLLHFTPVAAAPVAEAAADQVAQAAPTPTEAAPPSA